MSSELATTQPRTVKDYLALPTYKDRFTEVMGKRANQFMAAIVASSQLPGLKDAEPRSVIAAAMVAATLDLPVNPTLGQAHLVAYADSAGQKVAQFQIGYKGLIQLALRSGQYKRLNAGPVNGSVFKGYDMVGEPVLDWTAFDPVGEVSGYFCAFETLNGFIKVVYWSREQAESHAKRFSRAYAKGYSTPWKSDFDSMATKTVIKAALGKWGLLSVEMQKAVVHDQGVQADVDSEVKYVDGDDKTVEDQVPGDPPPERPAPPKREARGAAKVRETVRPEVVVPAEPPASVTVANPAPEPKVETFAQAAAATEPAPVAPEPAPTPAPDKPKERAFLNRDERVEVVAKVKDATGFFANIDGVMTPSAQVNLAGGYFGTAFHIGGGILVSPAEKDAEGKETKPAVLACKEPWKPGAEVRVKLIGKHSAAANKVRAVVEAVEAVAEEF